MAIEKNQNPGSSKTAPRVLIFSMAMGADYSFEFISIELYVPQFIGHNKFFLGSAVWTTSELMTFDFRTIQIYTVL